MYCSVTLADCGRSDRMKSAIGLVDKTQQSSAEKKIKSIVLLKYTLINQQKQFLGSAHQI